VNSTPCRRAMIIACALLSSAGLAQTTAEPAAWSQLHARLERMSERDLKAMYLRCSRDSSQRMLGFGEAARCSIGHEVLKKRSFGGDFNALLAWWRTHRDDPLEERSGE
jgi:hypothetical protein